MEHIKKFNDMVTESISKPLASQNVLKHLKDGDAILVSKEDLSKFYETLGYYIWIHFTRLDPEVVPPVLFFVLIGNKIYHTHKPSFGGQDFNIYEPDWVDLKPYKK